MSHSRITRGVFSILDLAVLLIGLSLFACVTAAVTEKTDERANRIACANNLRQIGQALHMYSNENKGIFPRTSYDMERPENVAMFTNWRARNPFGADGPEPNDVTAAYFLLLRTQDIPARAFHCPSSKAKPFRFGLSEAARRAVPGQTGAEDPVSAELRKQQAERAATQTEHSVEAVAGSALEISNFPGPQYMSYSFANPYGSRVAVSSGFKLNNSASGIIIAADLNPGGKGPVEAKIDQMPPWEQREAEYSPGAKQAWKFSTEQLAANSPNHGGFGQNVLEINGGVSWQATPFVAEASGPGRRPPPDKPNYRIRDNIYTRYVEGMEPSKRGDPIVGPPMDMFDTVLLPVADAGADPNAPAPTSLSSPEKR
jgi:hypothetical protein